ncbi:FIST C-terminal domain-containing protein [Candidatus Kuenenbacteria bacterium]|nr:FIST C-terminal domain-containing protein [Candidatus Kuenenbacteria bacterium]
MESIKTGIGRSNNADSQKAGQEACQQAIDQMGGKPDLIMVFSSVALDQEKMLQGVNLVASGAMVVGCSDSGEITTHGSVRGHVVVMAITSDQIKFTVGLGRNVKNDSFKAGQKAAEEVIKNAPEKISLFISLLEGLTGNGAAIVRGFKAALGEHFPIIGGSAGDDFAFKKTFVYYKDQVLNDTVIGIGLSGNFSWGVGVKHGWEPIGLPMKVTKSEGGVIKELDNKPALSIYQDYFGKRAEELIKEPIAKMAYTYPLGMTVKGSQELLIVDVVIANKKGEITCAAEVPEGSEVRLMLGDPEKAIQAAKEAAENALTQLNGAMPKAIFIFDCMARHKLLGAQINEEIQVVQSILGKETPLIGFYTYGEQAPLGGNIDSNICNSSFHNETMCLLVLGEKY